MQWIKQNPAPVATWLDGVTTFDGKPADAALKQNIAKQ